MDLPTIGIIVAILATVIALLQLFIGNIRDWRKHRYANKSKSPITNETTPVSNNQVVMLPRRLQPFVDRKEEIERIKASLKSLHIVQLRGLGGIGKTGLAIETAYIVKESFPDGVIYLSTIDYATLEDVINAIAHAFDIPVGQAPLADKKAIIQKTLQSKRALLVFDNVEDFEPIEIVVNLLPNCAALVTSRPPYIMPNAKVVEVGPMPQQAAVELFELNIGYNLSGELRMIAADIRGNLGDFPLAIEMAAKQIQISRSDIKKLAIRIKRATSLDELETIADDRSVRASFLSTFRQLSKRDMTLFASLGTFGGSSFALEAIKAVSLNDQAEKGLERLVALSLVKKVEGDRYSLHPLLKLFACEQLKSQVPYKRMAGYFCDYAVANSEDFDALEIERVNLQEAMNWSFNHGEWEMLVKTVQALLGDERDYGFLAQRGYWNDALVRIQQAIKASSELNQLETEAYMHLACGLFHYWFGQYDESRAAYNTAHQRFTEISNERGLVRVHWQLGYLEDDQDNYAKAEALYRRSLSLSIETRDNRLISASRELVGVVLYHRGQYQEARKELLESLKDCEARNDRAAIARTKRRLASVARRMAESSPPSLARNYLREARDLLNASLEIEQNQRSIARLLRQFGLLEQCLGKYPEAKDRFRKSLDMFRTLGNKKGVAATLYNIGTVLEDEGDWNAAESYYNESLAIGKKINMRSGTALNLVRLASVAKKRKDYKRSHEFAAEAVSILAAIESPHLEMAQSFLKDKGK